jgi:DNA-binding IclR family transcriptional regulator
VTSGLTIADICTRTGMSRATITYVLDDERRRGHVVYEGGRWRLSDDFAATFGPALARLPVR